MKKHSVLLIAGLFISLLLPAQSRYHAGLIFDDEAYENTPINESYTQDLFSSKIATRASLKAYAPIPKDQGQYNNCVGWSTAYAARTILEARLSKWKSQTQINANAFSPGFIYKLISDDQSCYQPTSINEALKVMRSKGAAKFQSVNAICPF